MKNQTQTLKQLCLVLTLLVGINGSLTAQFAQGWEQLERGEYATAQTVLEEAYQDKKESYAATYALAKLHSTPATDNFNVEKAYQYAEELRLQQAKVSNKQQQLLIAVGIEANAIPKLLQQIDEQLFAQAIATAQEDSNWKILEDFAIKYPTNQTMLHPSQTDFQTLNRASSTSALQEFATQHADSPYLPLVQQLLMEREFTPLKSSGDAKQWLAFIKKYPTNPYFVTIDKKLADLLQPVLVNRYVEYIDATVGKQLPTTLAELYRYYATSGLPGRLDEWLEHYPFEAENVAYQQDRATADLYRQLPEDFTTTDAPQITEYLNTAKEYYSAIQVLQKQLQTTIDAKNWNAVTTTLKQVENQLGANNPYLQQMIQIAGAPADNSIQRTQLTNLNTAADEYCPVINADGQAMYFCCNDNGKEMIFVSELNNEDWDAPKSIAALQKGGNKAPLAVSADGNELYFFERGRIKKAKRNNAGWLSPTKFTPFKSRSKWQGGTNISTDGKVMIFAARRAEMIGVADSQNRDLFVALQNKNGEWGTPQNLGAVINTDLNERTPFLHPDLKTLYFSSNGHGGLGQLDVYKTTRLDDSWLNWSKPVNLGKMINTSGDDWGYNISTDGKLAYFATTNQATNSQDIYSIDIPKDFRPQAVSTISGTLVDSEGQPVAADIIIEDLAENQVVNQVKSNPQTGEFFAVLSARKMYGYTIEKEGYYPEAGYIDLIQGSERQQIKKDLTLRTIKEVVEEKIALPIQNLFFATGKAEIQSSSYPALNRLANLINNNNLKIQIEGHTDNVGNDTANQQLSEQRAEAVRNYLITAGKVKGNTVTAMGFGESKPVADNSGEEGRAQNRRVEIRLGK